MREYEIVYIFDSTLEEEEVESKLDSYHERITDDGDGEITAVEDWGKRKLAYPIENQENGHYVVAQFTVDPQALEEFERRLNLDGDLLRHLVVLHEGELPTPPSARRPGAGPEKEDEEETEKEDTGGDEEESADEDGATDGDEPAGEAEPSEEATEDEGEPADDEDEDGDEAESGEAESESGEPEEESASAEAGDEAEEEAAGEAEAEADEDDAEEEEKE